MHDGIAYADRRATCNEQAKGNSHLLLGCRHVCLVFSSIFSCLNSNSPGITAPGEALGQAILTFFALCGFCLVFASLGNRILRALPWEIATDGEQVVVAIAVGLITIGEGCLAIVVLLCALMIREWKSVRGKMGPALREMVPATPLGKFLLILVAAVVSVEFLASQAPLTGSDALHYHFTVQRQILEQGFHPNLSISHSFLCRQTNLSLWSAHGDILELSSAISWQPCHRSGFPLDLNSSLFVSPEGACPVMTCSDNESIRLQFGLAFPGMLSVDLRLESHSTGHRGISLGAHLA